MVAPFVEKLASPGGRDVVPELVEIFLENVGPPALQVVARQVPYDRYPPTPVNLLRSRPFTVETPLFPSSAIFNLHNRTSRSGLAQRSVSSAARPRHSPLRQPLSAAPLTKPFTFPTIFRNRQNQFNNLQPNPKPPAIPQGYSQPRGTNNVVETNTETIAPEWRKSSRDEVAGRNSAVLEERYQTRANVEHDSPLQRVPSQVRRTA